MLGKHLEATLAEIDAQIRKLTEAKATLLELFGPNATAEPARPARKRTASPKTAPRTKTPARSAPKPAESTDADAASATGVRILKFLDKAGPSALAAIASGTKLRPNVAANGLRKLVRDGLAEDNDGHFRCTDKGFEAALA